MHHTYGKRKAEEEYKRMAKRKQSCACPVLVHAVNEEELHAALSLIRRIHIIEGKRLQATLLENSEKSDSDVFDDKIRVEIDDQPQDNAMQCESASSENTHGDTNCIPLLDVKEAAFVTSASPKKQLIKFKQKPCNSQLWYKECQWRVTASYFGEVCKMQE